MINGSGNYGNVHHLQVVLLNVTNNLLYQKFVAAIDKYLEEFDVGEDVIDDAANYNETRDCDAIDPNGNSLAALILLVH